MTLTALPTLTHLFLKLTPPPQIGMTGSLTMEKRVGSNKKEKKEKEKTMQQFA